MKKKKKINSQDHSYRKIIIPFLILFFILFTFFVIGHLGNKKRISSTEFSNDFEGKINSIVSGYPIEEMAPFISKKDKTTASFLVAIAKKESNWGKFSPKKDGKNCYNYWGYRGSYNQTDSGYSCFDSPEQAVNVVGERISEFVDEKIDDPKRMVVAWKCGFDCSTHSFFSVKKWEWDVKYYFDKMYY